MSFNYKIVQGNLVITDPTGKVTDIVQNLGNRLKTENILADGPQLDAYHKLRVSEKKLLFSAYFSKSDRSSLFAEKTVGSATVNHNPTQGVMEHNVTTAIGDKVIRQTRRYITYFPGQSHFVTATFQFGTLTTNCKQKIGYFDDNDGLFLQANGSTISLIQRTSTSGTPVDQVFNQSEWNLDKMDGTGESGILLDFTRPQFFVVDFQWQGSGRVRYGFYVNGKFIYVHETANTNNGSALPYMKNPSLPYRVEVENIGTLSNPVTMLHGCTAVFTEGNDIAVTDTFSINRATSVASVGTGTSSTILGIRHSAQFIRAQVTLSGLSVITTSNNDLFIELVINPTVVSPNFQPSLENPLEVDLNVSENTGGNVIKSWYIKSGNSLSPDFTNNLLSFFADVDGVSDTLYLRARAISNNAQVLASLNLLGVF